MTSYMQISLTPEEMAEIAKPYLDRKYGYNLSIEQISISGKNLLLTGYVGGDSDKYQIKDNGQKIPTASGEQNHRTSGVYRRVVKLLRIS